MMRYINDKEMGKLSNDKINNFQVDVTHMWRHREVNLEIFPFLLTPPICISQDHEVQWYIHQSLRPFLRVSFGGREGFLSHNKKICYSPWTHQGTVNSGARTRQGTAILGALVIFGDFLAFIAGFH